MIQAYYQYLSREKLFLPLSSNKCFIFVYCFFLKIEVIANWNPLNSLNIFFSLFLLIVNWAFFFFLFLSIFEQFWIRSIHDFNILLFLLCCSLCFMKLNFSNIVVSLYKAVVRFLPVLNCKISAYKRRKTLLN